MRQSHKGWHSHFAEFDTMEHKCNLLIRVISTSSDVFNKKNKSMCETCFMFQSTADLRWQAVLFNLIVI